MRCPHDGGACHHHCAEDKFSDGSPREVIPCMRKESGMSLSQPWPGFPVKGDHAVSDEYAQGVSHMASIPPCNVPWPEARSPQGSERLSCWFGLTYASWLTMPRVLMEDMPEEWQGKMAALLEEWDATWDTGCYGGTRVMLTQHGQYAKMDPRLINYRYPDREWVASLRQGIPAQTPPARAAVTIGWDANGSPVCEEPWSL